MTLRSFISLSSIIAIAAACRTERVEPKSACISGSPAESWTEQRTPAVGAADTARASLSLTLTAPLDSLDKLPTGAMISLLIAGPAGAERPDTVRLLGAEVPGGPLWSGNDLRPGTYSASLTTNGFAAGPKEFALAPGEQVRLEAGMGRTCDAPAK